MGMAGGMAGRANNLAFGMVALLIFWVPLPLASDRPWAWSLMEGWIFAAALLWLLSVAAQPDLGLRRLRPFWVLVAGLSLVQLLVLLQLVVLPHEWLVALSPKLQILADQLDIGLNTLSVDPGQTEISLFKGISYLVFGVLLLLLCDSRHRIKMIVFTIIASGVFQAVYASLELLSGSESSLIFQLPQSVVARGSFAYKNQLANFLVLSSAIAIGYLISRMAQRHEPHHKSRLYGWLDALTGTKAIVRLSIILMVIALVMTRSRMGNAVFMMSLTLMAVLALFFYKNKPGSLVYFLSSLFVLDAVIIGSWFGLDKVKQRLENTSLLAESRDEVVQMVMPMVRDFPLAGSGAGSFYSTFPHYHQARIDGFYGHAHNDYLQFATEYGLLATVCLGGILVYGLVLSYQTYSRHSSHHSSLHSSHHYESFYKGVSLGCSMAILAVLIHSTVDYSLQAPANAILLITILCLCWLCRYRPGLKKRLQRKGRRNRGGEEAVLGKEP